jgi:hypothetical protein
MATAHHEAGHAIVAMSFGIEVVRVTLEPRFPAPAWRLGVCCTRHGDDPNSYWAAAVVGAAGAAADQHYARYPEDVLAMMQRSAWATDRANAERWLGLIRGVTMKQCENMAAHLVDQHWDAITRVALALASEGEISGVTRLWPNSPRFGRDDFQEVPVKWAFAWIENMVV